MGFRDLRVKIIDFALNLGPLDLEQSCFGAHGLKVLVNHVVLARHLGELYLVVGGDGLGSE